MAKQFSKWEWQTVGMFRAWFTMVCVNDGKPTRRSSDSVIDLFLTSPELVPKISFCETLSYENIQSDHLAVLLEIAKNSEPNSSGAEEKYTIGKTDWKLWNEITEERFRDRNIAADKKKWKSVEEMYSSFKEVFDECRDATGRNVHLSIMIGGHTHHGGMTVWEKFRRTHPPWWNDSMREVKKKLNKAKRDFNRRST